MSSGAERGSGADRAFFETRIRPVLVKHCYECHAADSAELGGKLRLDHRAGLLQGGESGPALVPGKSAESLIVQALKYDGLQMPPEQPLPDAVIKDFENWISRGAFDPRTTEETQKLADTGTQQSTLWSLQPVVSPSLPDVNDANWPLTSIDSFILARLEQEGITPTADAESSVLVRRLYYDLIGLPPTLAEVRDFVSAADQDRNGAVTRLVDELLARPQFGERWGRYWLDVARYGESNGNDGLGRNPTFPHAWRYRDYVIQAFNEDMPFDQFVTEQIAGDLLPSGTAEERDRKLIATGFLALTSKPAKAMNDNFDMDVVADQIDVVSRGLMGISVACARCHDHKFDPVPTSDYYALAGIFKSTETLWGVAGHEGLTAPPTDLHVLKAAAHISPPEDFVETVLVLESNTGQPKAIPKSKWPVGTPLAMGVRDRENATDCQINIKGESKKLGERVLRGFLSACPEELAEAYPVDCSQSGRLQLAQWLTSADHPLTARVFVNRVWKHLFGTGIVATADDFGVYGDRPTHPELLDHLATSFANDGWSVKQLVRSIVLSRTYQLSSFASSHLLEADGENRLWGRHSRRRLDAEAIRDGMLQASGQLDLTPAEGSIIRHRDILVNLAGNLHQPSRHRSVYLCYLRSSPPPELAPFDLPDFTSVEGDREVNTLPAQALYLSNNPFVIEQAQALMHVVMSTTDNPEQRIYLAFERVLSREPEQDELQHALELVKQTTEELDSAELSWLSLCQALLLTSEFRYID